MFALVVRDTLFFKYGAYGPVAMAGREVWELKVYETVDKNYAPDGVWQYADGVFTDGKYVIDPTTAHALPIFKGVYECLTANSVC